MLAQGDARAYDELVANVRATIGGGEDAAVARVFGALTHAVDAMGGMPASHRDLVSTAFSFRFVRARVGGGA